MSVVVLSARLETRAPFDGGALLAHFAARAVPCVEAVGDGRYRRSLRAPHGAAVIELEPAADHVRLVARLAHADDLPVVAARCRALLDLDADPAAVAAVLGPDPLLGPLVTAAPGRRVPGSVDGAELALRAVLGQQVSLAAARTLAARVVAAVGQPLEQPVGDVTHLFPAPGAVAALDPARLAMPRARAGALQGLASALAVGELDLDGDPARARAELDRLPGIGPWTAGYIAMRALHDRDVFLGSDLGVRRALARLGVDTHPRAVAQLAERWRPYRAYATQHLLGLLSNPCASPSTPSRPTSRPAAARGRPWPAARPASG